MTFSRVQSFLLVYIVCYFSYSWFWFGIWVICTVERIQFRRLCFGSPENRNDDVYWSLKIKFPLRFSDPFSASKGFFSQSPRLCCTTDWRRVPCGTGTVKTRSYKTSKFRPRLTDSVESGVSPKLIWFYVNSWSEIIRSRLWNFSLLLYRCIVRNGGWSSQWTLFIKLDIRS